MITVEAPDLDHDKMMLERFSHMLSENGKLERFIVANLFAHLAEHDFYPRAIWDGEDVEKVSTAKEAMEFIFNLDEVSVRVAKGAKRAKGESRHGILLVLGEGVDIVADWNYLADDSDGFNACMEAFDVVTLVACRRADEAVYG